MRILNKVDIDEAFTEIQELGDCWHGENIPGPSQDAIRDSSRVLEQLYADASILPQRVTQSVEEGIYIDFVNGHRVILEMYNEGTAAIIVMDYKDIVDSVEVSSTDRVAKVCSLLQKMLKS